MLFRSPPSSLLIHSLHRSFDPLLGVLTGFFAYHLYETRLGRPEGHTLPDLVRRKWGRKEVSTRGAGRRRGG